MLKSVKPNTGGRNEITDKENATNFSNFAKKLAPVKKIEEPHANSCPDRESKNLRNDTVSLNFECDRGRHLPRRQFLASGILICENDIIRSVSPTFSLNFSPSKESRPIASASTDLLSEATKLGRLGSPNNQSSNIGNASPKQLLFTIGPHHRLNDTSSQKLAKLGTLERSHEHEVDSRQNLSILTKTSEPQVGKSSKTGEPSFSEENSAFLVLRKRKVDRSNKTFDTPAEIRQQSAPHGKKVKVYEQRIHKNYPNNSIPKVGLLTRAATKKAAAMTSLLPVPNDLANANNILNTNFGEQRPVEKNSLRAETIMTVVDDKEMSPAHVNQIEHPRQGRVADMRSQITVSDATTASFSKLVTHVTGFQYERTDVLAKKSLDKLHFDEFKKCHSISYDDMKLEKEFLPDNFFYVYFDRAVGGLGLKAAKSIPAKTILCLYAGRVITEKERKALVALEDSTNEDLTGYLFEVTKGNYINGRLEGNAARFVNNACNPVVRNIRFERAKVGRRTVVQCRSRVAIKEGQIIWAKYGDTSVELQDRYKMKRCKCPLTTHHLYGIGAKRRHFNNIRGKKGFSKRLHKSGGFGYTKTPKRRENPESSDSE